MIAPQEIRIGNFVHSPYDGHVVKVNAADIFLMANAHHREARFEPIELTEEWLLKFGFEKKQIRTDLKNKLGDYAYSLNSVPFFTLIQDNDGFILSKFKTYLITVKNVHQLQNLIHSLCGEELKIKES